MDLHGWGSGEVSARDARGYAMSLLRRRLARGCTRRQIETITYEGACGPASPGYLITGGQISVPGFISRDQPGAHTFRLAELLGEIESPGSLRYAAPQMELFA